MGAPPGAPEWTAPVAWGSGEGPDSRCRSARRDGRSGGRPRGPARASDAAPRVGGPCRAPAAHARVGGVDAPETPRDAPPGQIDRPAEGAPPLRTSCAGHPPRPESQSIGRAATARRATTRRRARPRSEGPPLVPPSSSPPAPPTDRGRGAEVPLVPPGPEQVQRRRRPRRRPRWRSRRPPPTAPRRRSSSPPPRRVARVVARVLPGRCDLRVPSRSPERARTGSAGGPDRGSHPAPTRRRRRRAWRAGPWARLHGARRRPDPGPFGTAGPGSVRRCWHRRPRQQGSR